MKFANYIIAAALSLSAAAADAAINVTFPGLTATYIAQENGNGTFAGGVSTYAWTAGDNFAQSYAATGLAAASSWSGSLDIENALGQDLSLDFYLNGIDVGGLVIANCNSCLTRQTISYDFDFATITGPDYDLEVRWANTIPDGQGSIRVFAGGTATLDGATMPAVPEPASWAMLIAGFGMIGAVQRRRQAVAFG